MKITIKEPGHEPRCIIFPIGLLANQFTAGIAWGALSLAIHMKLPYRIPKELIKELRRTTLPQGIPLVEYKNTAGTLVTVEL